MAFQREFMERSDDVIRSVSFLLLAIVVSEVLGSNIAGSDHIKAWRSDIAVVVGVTNDKNLLEIGQ